MIKISVYLFRNHWKHVQVWSLMLICPCFQRFIHTMFPPRPDRQFIRFHAHSWSRAGVTHPNSHELRFGSRHRFQHDHRHALRRHYRKTGEIHGRFNLVRDGIPSKSAAGRTGAQIHIPMVENSDLVQRSEKCRLLEKSRKSVIS